MSKKSKKKENKKGCISGLYIGSLLKAFFLIFIKYTGLWLITAYSLVGLALWLIKKSKPFFVFNTTLGLWYSIGFFIAAAISLIITVYKIIVIPGKSVVEGFKHPLWKQPEKENSDDTEKAEDTKVEKDETPLAVQPNKKLSKRKLKAAQKARQELAESVENQPQIPPVENPPFMPPQNPNFLYMNGYQQQPPYPPNPYQQPMYPPNNPYNYEQQKNLSQTIMDTNYAQFGPRNNAYDDITRYPRGASVPPGDIPAPAKEEPKIYLSSVEPNTLVHEYSNRFEVFKLRNGKTILDKVEYKNSSDNLP